MSPLFDKYTDRAKRVLMFAQEESRRFNHNYIGTEHLLLGLVRVDKGPAAKALNGMGVDLAKVRSAVEFIVGRGERAEVGDISLTPHARKVIELAAEEARRLGHNYIGTEHLLLGLVAEGEGMATGILESLGAHPSALRSGLEFVVRRRKRADETRLGFTPGANKALGLAAEEARRLGHSEIGTGHLLLGLVREGEGLGANILQSLGANLQRVRQQVRQAVSQGEAS